MKVWTAMLFKHRSIVPAESNVGMMIDSFGTAAKSPAKASPAELFSLTFFRITSPQWAEPELISHHNGIQVRMRILVIPLGYQEVSYFRPSSASPDRRILGDFNADHFWKTIIKVDSAQDLKLHAFNVQAHKVRKLATTVSVDNSPECRQLHRLHSRRSMAVTH